MIRVLAFLGGLLLAAPLAFADPAAQSVDRMHAADIPVAGERLRDPDGYALRLVSAGREEAR